MPDKPPLPTTAFGDWPRIPVDDTRGTDAAQIIRMAVRAGDDWALGKNGPYKNPSMTLAEITGGAIREALLHLMELGLIDIDAARMHTAKGWPTRRTDFRPAEDGDPS